MHLRLIFLFSTFISVLKGDELPLAPYNVKLFCRTGERNVSTKGLSPPIECPSSSSSCGYLEFETKDPRFSKNAGKVGLFECVDSGILHQENDEYDDDKETESIFGEICGPIPRCSLLHLRAFNPNFLKYVIASQNIQLKMIAKPTVKFCCALYHSTLSRLVNSGNDQLPSITAPAVHCGDLECGQGAIGCLLHSRYGKKGEFDGKRERLAKEKMEMEKDEESFEEYEVDEEELVIPSGSQSRLFTNRVITGSRKRRAVQDDYEDQIKAVEISFGEDEDTYLKGMDVIEYEEVREEESKPARKKEVILLRSGGPGPRSTALPYTSIESLEDENENDGTHHCVYRHLNDERYRYCLLIHSEKDGDRCYEHKGHSICCCFVPPDQNTCDPTDLDLVVPAPSLAPKKRITTTFATTIKSDIELKETAKSDEGFLETLTTTTTTTTTSPPPREQIPATEDPILVTTTLSTTMMTKKRKGRPRITVKAPSTSPNLRNGCRIVYPGPRRNDGPGGGCCAGSGSWEWSWPPRPWWWPWGCTHPTEGAPPTHDVEATPERVRRLAQLSIILTLVANFCGQSSTWICLRALFFAVVGIKYDTTNGSRVRRQVEKASIHIWTRVERLRRQDPAGKRTFIPSPFGHKLSFARLAHQLESPIVETLNGWRFICKVAKAMCEPLRLTMAEAVAEQRDRLEACKEQLEEILSSDEFWADCETWFEDGDGGYILNVLHTQVTMMEAKMASPTPAERVANEFHGEKYVELYFRFHIKRRTLYYGLNWVVPSVLISLSNVLGFTLPTECGEKLTLQITNLLAVLVFLGMVSEIIPPSSESIPVVEGSFLSGEFSMQKSSLMNESDRDDEWRERGNVNEIVEKRNFSTQRPRLLSIERDYAPLQAELREIIILMQSFKEKLDEDAVEEECQADYKYIAMCLDRMFLFVFSAAYLSTVTAMLIATPRVLSTSA
ncbi:unnamed protein product, partial [Mesorhabditis belari]|uniref:Neurotransmitter-gated ion-channel transmembrane domain-containing protein n=1 Tax=Mesorhabditis belari TaxID=2138241 RepID=A0AAF3EUA9_9BILA